MAKVKIPTPYGTEKVKKVVRKLKKRTDRIQSNKKARAKIMGDDVHRQNMRGQAAKIKAAVTPGDSVAKAKGRQAVKRVGEYKRKKRDPQFTLLAKTKKENF